MIILCGLRPHQFVNKKMNKQIDLYMTIKTKDLSGKKERIKD